MLKQNEKVNVSLTRGKLTIEEAVIQYFQNKEMVREYNEENKMLKEYIEKKFDERKEHELVVPLPSEGYGKVYLKGHVKEVLNKEALAHDINEKSKEGQSYISPSDLKTHWDFSMLTKQERITPKMIAECTETVSSLQTKVTRVKREPKKLKVK
ncbi:hypothetical protein IMZ31_22980 (plasmid) [Pontibacillus sp. ALD_SL1]|uniref:hypothetical protein n=1 Tax=Pontibacillus sp. ALD_SL1 TaxID=2777185 RepID=UPI001A95B5B7|nr:hypothetical protein [Pontibacillus sp. ALD_SL1]QST02318.1 hypothetical protein IMZ31_22980 [Pontibacillus sp. ALD_SL1]